MRHAVSAPKTLGVDSLDESVVSPLSDVLELFFKVAGVAHK